MKPNRLRTEIFLLPQPPHRFYSKADREKDQSQFGIDLGDAIHAALNGLALAGRVDWEEVGSDLIDMAVDVIEGTTVHPPESQDMENYPDDAAIYWGKLQDSARRRVGELLLIADTFLLPYIPAIRKRGQVVAMESFRAFLKHTYEVQMLMEPNDDVTGYVDLPKVWNSPLSEGTDINTLNAPGKYWFPCNQYDLDIAPVGSLEACFLTDQIKSLSDIEAISFNSMATGHAMESVGYRWDDLQSPHLTMGELLDKPLYLTDDPFKWSSPWLRGDKVLRLTRVKYRITNPLVEIDHPTPYEFLHSADTLPHMRQRHDSIVHVHDRTQDRQMVLLNPKTQVLDIDTVPMGLVAKYLSDIARREDVPINRSIVDIPGLAKAEVSLADVAATPVDPPLVFFTSRHAELIYKLTQLQGAQRCNELGITRVHYVDRALADAWYMDIASKLQGTGGGLSVRALREATRIYKTLIDTDDFRKSTQTMVGAMETNGCLPTGEF